MGRGGASATDRAAAASGAGRVFDRGDIKYPAAKSRGSAVDARGVKARSVPRHIRQKPRWQALDRKEQAYRADQAKAQERIETIKKKLQAGKGNKGELQVELVRAREKHDKIKSKIHVVKVEKEGFFLSLDEKPAIKKGKEKAPEPNAGKTKGAK